MRILSALIFLLLQILYSQIKPTAEATKDLYSALTQIHKQLWLIYGFDTKKGEDKIQKTVQQDVYKILHPDIIYEDDYCHRNWNDTIKRVYRKHCFLINTKSPHFSETKNKISTWYENPGRDIGSLKEQKKISPILSTSLSLMLNGMDLKTNNQQNLAQYQQLLKDNGASLNCLNDLKITPSTYLMTDKKQCLNAISILTNKFEKGDHAESNYILKTNSHLGRGVEYINRELFETINQKFNGGQLCGNLSQKEVIQELVKNPVQINRRKVDFRLWVLVVNVKPLIIYIYDTTMVINCVDPYDERNLTVLNFVCNGGVAKRFWLESDEVPEQTETLTLDEVHLCWSMKRWNQFFIEQGLTTDPDWWQKVLLPKLKTKVAYFMRVNLPKNIQDPRFQGAFAYDVSITFDGDVKLLDFNWTPNVNAFTLGNLILQLQLHKDVQLLLKKYLIIRFKKVQMFIQRRMSRHLLQIRPVTSQEIMKLLTPTPFDAELLHNFHLVDTKQAVQSCLEYDVGLNDL